MWQRQIQCLPLARAPRRSPIGCGSWTITASHSPCSPSALIWLISSKTCPLLLAERLRRPLQRVVQELGRVEELLLAEDHVPVGVEADVAHQRHDRVEDLGDAAAEGGGADVQHALALQRLGELADLLRQLLADDVRVVGEGLLSEGDFLKQGRSSTRPGGAIGARLSPRGQPSHRFRALAERDLDLLPSCRRGGWSSSPFRRVCGSATRRARSSGSITSWPSTSRITSPPVVYSPAWNLSLPVPPLSPAFSAGPPGTTSAIRPPKVGVEAELARPAAGRAPGWRRRCRRIRPCRLPRVRRPSA